MNQIVTSSKKILYRILLGVFIGLFGFLSVKLFNDYDSHSILKAGNLVFSIVCFLVFTGCLLTYMSVKDVTITDTKAEFSSFLGKKTTSMRLSDIKGYTLQVLPNKNGKDSEAITLFGANNESVKLKGNLYNNYDEMKELLIKNATHNEELEAQLSGQTKLKSSIVMIAVGFIVLGCGYLARETEVKPKDIVYIKDMAYSIEKITGRKGNSSSLTVCLMNHPDFKFRIKGLSFHASDYEGALHEIHTGSPVTIGICKEEYDKKISKKVAPNAFDKYFDYEHIKVYALSDNKYEYLSVEDYNEAVKKSIFFGMGYFSFMGIILLVLGIYNYFKARKSTTQINS